MRSDPMSIWHCALLQWDIQGEHVSLGTFSGPFSLASRTFLSKVLMDTFLSWPFNIFSLVSSSASSF